MDEEMNGTIQEEQAGKLETPQEILNKYRQSVETSERFKHEILEGLKAGAPLEELFLKATRIVSLLTDNPNFSQLCEKHMHDGDK